MDILKAEMEKKRKAAEELAGGKKYLKRADVEAAREHQYWKEKLAIEEKKEKALEERLLKARGTTLSSSSSVEYSGANSGVNNANLPAAADSKTPSSATSQSSLSSSSGDSNRPPGGSGAGEEHERGGNHAGVDQAGSSAAATLNISAKEVIRRLRKRGEPIRLFAETDEQRLARVKRLEEEAGENMEGQRNDFMKNLNELDRELDLESLKKKAEKEHGKTKEEAAVAKAEQFTVVPINYERLKKNKGSIYMAIHDYFNVLLLEWEQELNSRPDEERRSRKGKSDQAIMQQSKEYLQPLFKLCKKKQLPDDILVNIVKICMNMQERDYVQAYDTYCELSIGNAPWPIGVTMVGIHERSGREKISSNQVAHVLNDEKTRKWIQSMKRLMTFSQKKHPPEDLAKTIGWTKD